MWKPWIGPKFSDNKILLLAESCYDWWSDTTGEWIVAEDAQPIVNVEALRRKPDDGARTMKVLTKAICSHERPSAEQSSARWDCFAYTNYVPGSVGQGATKRPTEEAWSQAELEWPSLLEHIQPKVILVLGKGLWGYMPKTHDVRSKNIQAYAIPDSDPAWCFAVRHPSHGPSWTIYAAWIAALERYVVDGDLPTAIQAFE